MISAFDLHFSEKTKIKEACQKISGIGGKMALQALDRAGISGSLEIQLLSASQLSHVKAIIEQNYDTNSELRALTKKNIAQLSSIRSYRGRRHSLGLPCRGQRTHSNAQTCRRRKQK